MDFIKMTKILGLDYDEAEGLPILVLKKEGNEQLILEWESESSISIFNVSVGEYPPKRLGIDISFENISFIVYLEDRVIFESISEDNINLLEVFKGGSFKMSLGLNKKDYRPAWISKRMES